MTAMKAGFACVDATPDLGSPLCGFIARTRDADGIDRPIQARALYLEHAVIIGLDVVGLDESRADALVREAAAIAGVDEDAVAVCCSHTHAGPMTIVMRGFADADEDYNDLLHARALQAVRDAVADATDAQAGWARAPLRIAVNRRQPDAQRGVVLGKNPDGPAPRDVSVVCLQTQTRRIALLTYAVHPYCFDTTSSLISPDLHGYARDALAEAGIDAVYLNGCAGNISPTRAFEGVAAARALGKQMAAAVQTAWQNATLTTCTNATAASVRFDIPNDEVGDIEPFASYDLDGDHTVKDAERQNTLVADRLRRAHRQWYEDMRAALDTAGDLPPRKARITVMHVAGGTLAILPGEVFYEIGERIERALGASPCAVAAYGHTFIGYLPTAEAYPLGGYEVDEAHRYIGWWRASPKAPDLLHQHTLQLHESLLP